MLNKTYNKKRSANPSSREEEEEKSNKDLNLKTLRQEKKTKEQKADMLSEGGKN